MAARSALLFAVIALLAAAGAAQDGADSARPLFDGRSLDGWRGDPRFWSVEDGAIVGRSTPDQPCERNTYLVHEGRFADFELRFSYLIEGGNSGLQYRSRALEDFTVAGPQADLEAGPDHSGILYEERGRGILARRGERVRIDEQGRRSVEVFAAADALQAAIRREGWNDYVVRAIGPRIVHEINGVTMVEVEDRSPQAAREGVVALQLHAGPPMTVRFRDLRLVPLAAAAAGAAEPEWIWAEQVGDGQRVLLRRRFELPAALRRASLVATCDNRFELFVDGRRLLAGDEWQRARTTQDLGPLEAGPHLLAVDARNDGGPAGFVLRLELDCADGSRVRVVSDASWRAGGPLEGDAWQVLAFDDSAWPGARSFGPTGATSGPWPDPFVEREATPADALRVPAGYRAELLRSAGVGEGSWIALCFDRHGRALVSQEAGPLSRISFDDDGARFETIDEAPRAAMGLCEAFGALYVQGHGAEGFGLYRLRDADDDGRYEDVARILALGSPGEHGAHAVVPGPDGRLWLMNGNLSALPAALAPSSPHSGFAEDVLLPRIEDPRGHANGVRAPGGHVLRCRPDGSEPELFAAGFRNAYDLAFGPDGEPFTFDSDMEWDLGLPWYRPTRVIHVVSGGDYGWRTGAGKWRPGFPDSLPAAVDVGLSSPTGIVHGAGLRFAPAERGCLFVGDWAYGRILAVRLRPRGASFDGTFEQFVSGRPLNVTDLAVGPDGALWFTTGGRGTQSGLYRVVWTGAGDAAAAAPALNDDHDADAARVLRRSLERHHGRGDREALEAAWPALGHADRFVRHAARIAVESVPLGLWYERAIALPPGDAALQALLAVARRGEDADRDEVLRRLGAFDADAFAPAQGIDWLRTHEVALARRATAVGEDLRLELLLRLDARYPSGDVEFDRLLLQLLVALGAEQVAPRALDRLEAIEVEDGIEIAYALRLVGALRPEDRARLFRWLGAAKALDGGLSRRGYLDAIERDALQHVPEPDRRALQELAAPPAPAAAPALPAAGDGARAWTEGELAPYLAEVSRGRDFARGELAYQKAACAACHRFDGRGGDVGPDLTAIASRFSRRDLLRAVLEPSADVPDQYQSTLLTLSDGRVVVGRVLRDAAEIELLVDPVTGRRERFAAAEVASRQPSPVSAMPPGLLGTLSLEEVLDLLAYLESGGNRSHPAFERR